MPRYPTQSFEHTLREISVNRNDPCELVRELVSNSYDAGAKNIHLFPLYDQKGLIYFDDGIGLSESSNDAVKGVLPYEAFFSIGKGTKTPGDQIGYKCQGSKLCFASKRFSLITRCKSEKQWRWMSLRQPKSVLNEKYDIKPQPTAKPWEVLADDLLGMGGKSTSTVLGILTEPFFDSEFKTGLMIIIEEFEADNFDQYFSVSTRKNSYLREYIRFYTAHADVRRISRKEYGFKSNDINQLKKHIKPLDPPELYLWTSNDAEGLDRESVLAGWPYLPVPKKGLPGSAAQSPEVVPRLRDGTFYARYADSFKFEGRFYNLILAIDGKRRALDEYPQLSRQSSFRSGIPLADQRGVILCSQGIRVCQYNQILEQDALNGWRDLVSAIDHFVFFLDGPFELVTNRNLPSQSATSQLKNPQFLKRIADFLNRVATESGGETLRELRNRVRKEATAARENVSVTKTNELKDSLSGRDQIKVEIPGSTSLAEKWFVVPSRGEEHFVGALYTLLSYSVSIDHPLAEYWHRPLTFKSLGIDALAVSDEKHYLKESQLQCIEYKYHFSSSEEFNHPLTITDRIICWTLDQFEQGSTIEDNLGYQATLGEPLIVNSKTVGFVLTDIRTKEGGKERDHAVRVLCLPQLLEACFKVQKRPAPRPKGTKSRG
jgi:hypothetical protein